MRVDPSLVLASVVLLVAGAVAAEQPAQSIEVLSKTYTIDRKYRSMEGPRSTQPIILLNGEPAELVWITGYRAVMVGPDGTTLASQEFMCHSNLDVNPLLHRELFRRFKSSRRIFTLSQGQQMIRLPLGFGIPVMSNEPLPLTTQVLNHNLDNPHIQVRHQITIEFLRDRDLTEPMKPLSMVGPYVMVLLEGEDGYYGVERPTSLQAGSSCLLGSHASAAGSGSLYTDQYGRKFSGHWVVKPGRQEHRTLVTQYMRLPFDTTIHYAAAHLHPFAESLELRDLMTNQPVLTLRARNFPDHIGLEVVEEFSSVDGIPLYKDHDYELVSVYHNTTSVDQDSMAVMLLYVLDKDFQKPSVSGPGLQGKRERTGT